MTEEELKKIKEKYPEYTGARPSARFIDMTNYNYESWHVLYRTENKNNKARWVCKCDCGNIKIYEGTVIRNGTMAKSCGCKNYKDYTGQTFGKLTVKKMLPHIKYKDQECECLCECGNIKIVKTALLQQGSTKSCGCAYHDRMMVNNPRKINEEKLHPGDTFNYLQIIQFLSQEKNHKYLCKCKCGNEKIVAYTDLIRNQVQSCGCKSLEKRIDIAGKSFGYLTAIECIERETHSIWRCKCKCGNYKNVRLSHLRSGNTQSCGCMKGLISSNKIAELLQKLNMNVIREKTFPNCKYKRLLKFDFFVNNKYIIEYDGEQHFKPIDAWGGEEALSNTRERDLIKNKYCFDNNIPLIRIPYDVDYTIDDLKLEITRFLLTPENEQEYYNRS